MSIVNLQWEHQSLKSCADHFSRYHAFKQEYQTRNLPLKLHSCYEYFRKMGWVHHFSLTFESPVEHTVYIVTFIWVKDIKADVSLFEFFCCCCCCHCLFDKLSAKAMHVLFSNKLHRSDTCSNIMLFCEFRYSYCNKISVMIKTLAVKFFSLSQCSLQPCLQYSLSFPAHFTSFKVDRCGWPD